MNVITVTHSQNGALSLPSISEKLQTQTHFEPSIKNTKELVQAELRGQKISIGEEQLIKAIEKANKSLEGTYTTFEFSIHETTKQIMVKVLDRKTGETIREIPPEKILDLVAKLWEMAGILIDEKR